MATSDKIAAEIDRIRSLRLDALRRQWSRPAGYYGDYSLAALDRFISTKFSISALSSV